MNEWKLKIKHQNKINLGWNIIMVSWPIMLQKMQYLYIQITQIKWSGVEIIHSESVPQTKLLHGWENLKYNAKDKHQFFWSLSAIGLRLRSLKVKEKHEHPGYYLLLCAMEENNLEQWVIKLWQNFHFWVNYPFKPRWRKQNIQA